MTSPSFEYSVRCMDSGMEIPRDNVPFGGTVDESGRVANHEVVWDIPQASYDWTNLVGNESGIWRYGVLMPVGNSRDQVTLGEGQTPLLRLRESHRDLGHEQVFVKNEAQNPTWSHKDRLAAAAVSKAKELGATGITVASTGNHAAAAAAYAARAGLHCFVFTTTSVPAAMRTLMQAYGAVVVAAEDFETRTRAMEACYRAYSWWPLCNIAQPPAGSTCWGIEGYKSIAFELFEQFGMEAPEVVVLPTAYGDLTYGVFKGFVDLLNLGLIPRLPKIVAVEPFGSLIESLDADQPYPIPSEHTRPTPAFSTAAPTSTYQALTAVRRSNGTAVACRDDNAILEMQDALGTRNGLFVEAASATSVLAVRQLVASGWLDESDRVVCVLTSSGLKDPETPAKRHGSVPVISSANPQHVAEVMATHYGVDVSGAGD